MNRAFWLLISILIFAAILRLYNLGHIPSGFYSDEALVGYEAYSLLTTGHDQYGKLLPVVFKGFGDYRPGLLMYITAPFVGIFGLNEFAVRLPAALFNIATIFVIYLLVLELLNSQRLALASSLFFAITPWSLHFSRQTHETNLATFLVTTGLYALLYGIRRRQRIAILGSFFLFSLSVYSYYTPRVFIPIFFVFSFFYFRNIIRNNKKTFLTGLLLALVICIPFFRVLTDTVQGWSRVHAVNLWTDEGLVAKTESLVHEDVLMQDKNWRFFHNKVTSISVAFMKSMASHVNPDFLLFNGDPVKIYQTPENGILLWLQPLFVAIGIIFLIKTNFKHNWLFAAYFLFALLPDGLTRFYPAAARIHLALPLIAIWSGIGFITLIDYLRRNFITRSIAFSTLLLLAYNLTFFMHSHFIHAPLRFAKEWHYGVRPLVTYIKNVEKDYDLIWSSKKTWGWMNYAFYLKYPPKKLQKEIVLTDLDEFGFGWVYQFDKYRFEDLPQQYDFSKKILYVGTKDDFPGNINPQFEIKYPDGSVAFWAVTTEELRRICPACQKI